MLISSNKLQMQPAKNKSHLPSNEVVVIFTSQNNIFRFFVELTIQPTTFNKTKAQAAVT